MHTFLLAIALASSQMVQPAAPPASGSDWLHVQALPTGASVQVTTKTGHGNCSLKSVDADTLTCTQGKEAVYQRADIVSIKVPRRGRSALIGMAIGAGAGAGVGAASGSCAAGNNCIVSRPAGAAIFAIPGAGVGALIGYFTSFAKSTVYKAP